MKNNDFSIFEFRKLPAIEKQQYLKQARRLLPKDYTDSIIEIVAADLWAKYRLKKKNQNEP